MGARASVDSPPLRGIAYILIAGSAFCASAFTSIDPAVIGIELRGDAYSPSGSGRGNHVESRPFYLRCQYSSFADDTALYARAYADAERRISMREKAGGTESEPESREKRYEPSEYETVNGCDNRNSSYECHAGQVHTILAGTISHHLFIRNLIAEYFIDLSRHVHPKTIILIGPNHHARGHSPIAVSALRWRTPFGFVEPDSEAIRKVACCGFASVEEEPFVNEHSIGALVPFIRKTFPGSRIVPIIFKKVANREDCGKLASVLAGLMDSTLILASLDFSHYKTSREAEVEDAASLKVLRSLYTGLVEEAFVDSRPALLTLMQTCKNLGATNVNVVQHTNSGILAKNPHVACTSYINTWISTRPHQMENFRRKNL